MDNHRIDPKRAHICWNRCGKFYVFERPKEGAADHEWQHLTDTWDKLRYDWEIAAEPRSMLMDVGAAYSDWRGTPDEIFEALCYVLCNTVKTSGPIDFESLNACLDEFTKIRGCGWAKSNPDYLFS